MSENWLGIDVDFSNVEDKVTSAGFELLPIGWYKAEIKNVNKSVIGENNKSALTIALELEDSKKEIVHNLFLPQNGDPEDKIQFKKENLRNFFSRCAFNKLTKKEYQELKEDEKQVGISLLQNNPKGTEQFKGIKVQVYIEQTPFISKDKTSNAINFTEKLTANLIGTMPKKILTLINDNEKKGINIDKMPVILFSNNIAAHGFNFYADYEEKVLKNSATYEWVQANLKGNGNVTTNIEPAKVTPRF